MNGWGSPPGQLFSLRSKSYLTTKKKLLAGQYFISPAGVDWLKSPAKLENVLARPDNRVMKELRHEQESAVNLQVPGRDQHSAVFYFAAVEPIEKESLLFKFIVNRIVKGPWIVKTAVGNHSACLLWKALRIDCHRGENSRAGCGYQKR